MSLKFVALKLRCAFNFFFFFQLIAQFYTLTLILFHFDKCWPSLADYLLFSVKIAKNVVFALCYEISIAEVRLRFNLVRNAVPQLRCASEIKK